MHRRWARSRRVNQRQLSDVESMGSTSSSAVVAVAVVAAAPAPAPAPAMGGGLAVDVVVTGSVLGDADDSFGEEEEDEEEEKGIPNIVFLRTLSTLSPACVA